MPADNDSSVAKPGLRLRELSLVQPFPLGLTWPSQTSSS
jgi:hypothetical protein